MEYRGKFGHTIGRIQHITLMSRIDLCYVTFLIDNQTVAPTLPGLQGIKRCVQYLDSHPHKPIFYPSNCYDGSNVIRMRIMLELSTEDGQFRVLSTIYLVLLSTGKCRFSQL